MTALPRGTLYIIIIIIIITIIIEKASMLNFIILNKISWSHMQPDLPRMEKNVLQYLKNLQTSK